MPSDEKTPTAQVLIVDDEPDHAEVMAEALRRMGHVCTLVHNLNDATDEIKHGQFDLIVTDLVMDNPDDGQKVLAVARQSQPEAETIMVTAHGDVPTAKAAIKGGAYDFIEKPFDDEFLLKRIREAITFDIDQRADDQKVDEARAQLVSLTARENQVMAYVVAGKLNKQIAAELGISAKTVENHRARVMEKMGVKGLAELVHLANLLNIAAPDASGV